MVEDVNPAEKRCLNNVTALKSQVFALAPNVPELLFVPAVSAEKAVDPLLAAAICAQVDPLY